PSLVLMTRMMKRYSSFGFRVDATGTCRAGSRARTSGRGAERSLGAHGSPSKFSAMAALATTIDRNRISFRMGIVLPRAVSRWLGARDRRVLLDVPPHLLDGGCGKDREPSAMRA